MRLGFGPTAAVAGGGPAPGERVPAEPGGAGAGHRQEPGGPAAERPREGVPEPAHLPGAQHRDPDAEGPPLAQ